MINDQHNGHARRRRDVINLPKNNMRARKYKHQWRAYAMSTGTLFLYRR